MQTTYEEANRLKERIMEEAVLHALAILHITADPKDDVSEAQARKLYGKAWITDRTERGGLHYTRSGAGQNSTKFYSRFEIECLKMAEKKTLDKYLTAKNFIENESRRTIQEA